MYFSLYNEKLYNINHDGEVEIYDIESDIWSKGTQAANLYIPIRPLMYNDKIYILVGSLRGGGEAYCVYDIESDTWSSIAPFPLEDKSLGYFAADDNKIFVMDYMTHPPDGDSYIVNALYIYNIETDTWSKGSSMLTERFNFTPIIYNHKIYIAGGVNGTYKNYVSTLDVYDIATDTWTSLGDMIDVRNNYSAVLYKDDIYYIGGCLYNAASTPCDKVSKYNITSNTWENVSNLLDKRYMFGATVYNGKIYVTGGYNGIDIESFNKMEIYTIEDLTDIEYDKLICNVTPLPAITVSYGTTADALDALLPTQARVYFDNGEYDDLQIDTSSWDKSEYKADTPGEYTVYGTIELTNGIINPQNKKAEVTVKVNNPIRPKITEISPIQITADQSVPLEQEGLEHAFGVLVTVPLPPTVEATLDNGTTSEFNVTWDIDSYNPHQTGTQTISGEVELVDGIENPQDKKAELEITVTPTEYEIIEASPQQISVDVLAGTPKEEILEKIEQKTIDVDVLNAETSEEIYIYTGFTFSDEYAENLAYNPNQLGKQTLIGRFYDNFLDTIEPPYVEVEVNVVSSEIESVTEEHVNASQCMTFSSIEDLPQKVTVNLENGMTAEADVEWNSENYDSSIAGDRIITGRLVNLPSGAIQPEEEKTAVLIVHVQPVDYEITAVTPDEDFFETDKDGNELYAGFTLSELRGKLPVDKVKVQLTSVTENVNISTEYELDFTLEEENNPDYTPEDEFLDNLYGTLVLPQNISNPDNLMYEFMVKTNAVEITEIEPVSVMVDYYTDFADINLPDTVYANLSNGQRKAIGVTWNGDGYNPDPAELTEDNPVVFNLSGTLCDIPPYINHYDTDIPQLTITLVLPRVYKITDISPVRIPETGTRKINLGSSISDIYDLIENHTATVTLENLKGITSTQDLTFTLREEDNTHYDAMSEEEVELTAYINLPEGIENPDNKQLVISVKPTKYTIRTTVASRVNGIAKGTPFAEIAMPEKVTVNYTDTDTKQGEVPVASWDGSKYDVNKIGNQAIKGTFPDPLPVYVTNPNNRTPSAIVNVVDLTTTILSARQITEKTPFSAIKKSIRKAVTQTDEIDGYIERKYEVELLHKDGSITTEIISIFDEVEEN